MNKLFDIACNFMSDRFDWVADPKLFLVTVSNEIRYKRKTKISLKLKHIVKNIFGNLTCII